MFDILPHYLSQPPKHIPRHLALYKKREETSGNEIVMMHDWGGVGNLSKGGVLASSEALTVEITQFIKDAFIRIQQMACFWLFLG